MIKIKIEKKRNSNNNLVKTRGMHEEITFLVTNQILCPLVLRVEPKRKRKRKNKKGKGQNTQNPAF